MRPRKKDLLKQIAGFLRKIQVTVSCERTTLQFAVLFASLLLLPALMLAQSTLTGVLGVPPGAQIYPIPGLGFVNLANGNLHVEIPIRVIKDRNGIALTSSISYDNSMWQIIQMPGQSGIVYDWSTTPYYAEFTQSPSISVSPSYTGVVRNKTSTIRCGLSEGQQHQYWDYTDGRGTIHPFPIGMFTGDGGLSQCGYPKTIQAAATDGSGYWLEVTNENNGTVYDIHGNQVSSGGFDTNGNGAQGGFVGVLGQSTNLPSSFISAWKTIHVWTHFNYPGVAELGPYPATVLSSLTLPDGRSYSFQYDDAGDSPQQGHYGSLTGITLPTGGQITITSQVISSATESAVFYPASYVVRTIATPDGVWSFDYSSAAYLITATAPVDSQTGLAPQTTSGPYGSIVSSYSGTATGNPMRRVTTLNGPALPSNVTTTLENGQSSHVAYTYADLCTPRITTKKEYDFSGSLLRETDVAYGTSAADNTNLCKQWADLLTPPWTTAYLQNNHHITDIPTSITVYGPGGCCSSPLSQTKYTYDSTVLSTTSGTSKNSVLGQASHDDTNFGSSMTTRGNPTVVSQMVSAGSFITTRTNSYNVLGELVQSSDGKGNALSFDFSDSWKDASCISNPVFAYPPQ